MVKDIGTTQSRVFPTSTRTLTTPTEGNASPLTLIIDAWFRFDDAYSDGFVRRASRAKSCPNTPRAVTPTSTLSRAARNPSGAEPSTYRDYQGPQGAPPTHYTYTTPYISNGVYTPSPQYRGDYTEDDRYSFESRSLTAYSNYSERESTVDSSYRYPYAREPVLPEQPNPSRQAEDVVQMFLQKSFFPNSINNNSDKPPIGRIEDYSSTTSPSTSTLSPPSSSQSESAQQRASSRAAIAEVSNQSKCQMSNTATVSPSAEKVFLGGITPGEAVGEAKGK